VRILLTADPFLPVPPAGYGGIERIVDALAREYAKGGHSVALAAHRDSACPVSGFFPWPGERTLPNALSLLSAARSFRPDVVHSFSRLAYLLPILPRSVPKLMSYQRHVGGRQIAAAARIARGTLRFTGCSEFIASMGRSWGGDWTAVPNFIEVGKIRFVPSVGADAPLLFLSRIESIKGPDIAIAVAKAAGRRLVLAGNRSKSGPEADFFESRIAPHLGRDGIEWVGEVGDAQKDALLGQAAALVVPIQWDEPFGIVFAESLAAGTPVITCARGAAPEIIQDGVTGIFISNEGDGVSAVARIGELSREECRRSAETSFSSTVAAEKYLGLYRSQAAAGK
jgi:glycosyltransferase involved in cell wall biosynthesis